MCLQGAVVLAGHSFRYEKVNAMQLLIKVMVRTMRLCGMSGM